MGRSDTYIKPFYNKVITTKGEDALLGFRDNVWLSGDCYDISLNNWDINTTWKLKKKYDAVVIGSGPAGMRAAVQCAKKGKKVAVIDRRYHLQGDSEESRVKTGQ